MDVSRLTRTVGHEQPRQGRAGRTGMRAMFAVAMVVALGAGTDADPRGPGSRAVLGVNFTGNAAFTAHQLREVIATDDLVDANGNYRSDGLDRALLRLEAYYWDRGFAEVKVDRPIFTTPRSPVTIPIHEGLRFTIGTLGVTGDLIGSEAEHLSRLVVRPGDVFSPQVLATDLERLTEMYEDRGYAHVDVRPMKTIDRAAKSISLRIDVERGVLARFGTIQIYPPAVAGAIRRQLAFAPADSFSYAALAETKRRLVASGHYDDVNVTTTTSTRADVVNIAIEVKPRP
jgi:outer membrane protein insertion porin family